MSNLEDEDYKPNMDKAFLSCRRNLKDFAFLSCRRNLKDFAFRKGIKAVRVICPWSQLRRIEDDLWPDDPVHMYELARLH